MLKKHLFPKIDILETNNRVPWSGHMASYAIKDIYQKIKKSSLTIVFVNTRAQAELVFNKLWQENDNNLRIAIHHGSLEKEIKKKSRKLNVFRKNRLCSSNKFFRSWN